MRRTQYAIQATHDIGGLTEVEAARRLADRRERACGKARWPGSSSCLRVSGGQPLDELLRKAWIANGHSIAYGVIAPTEHNIDQFNKANVPGIYAIGDVPGPPMVAHRGRARGRRLSCLE